MEIIQAQEKDLIEVLYLLKVCILEMNKIGFKYWNSAYPDAGMIQTDLAEGSIFMLKDTGVCKGMMTLNRVEPEEYKLIKWPDDSLKPLYLHRMMIHPEWQGKGLAKMLFEFADDFARKNKYNCIRLDVYSQNEPVMQLYENQNYKQIGSFNFSYQQVPYICYEKAL